jgi:hypothetical protein
MLKCWKAVGIAARPSYSVRRRLMEGDCERTQRAHGLSVSHPSRRRQFDLQKSSTAVDKCFNLAIDNIEFVIGA